MSTKLKGKYIYVNGQNLCYYTNCQIFLLLCYLIVMINMQYSTMIMVQVCVCSVYVLHTEDGPENTLLKTSPPQEFYTEGSDITLSCSAVSRPPAQFTWVLNGQKLPDTGPVLTLTNITNSQSGQYLCQALNSKTLKTEKSRPSSVTVLGE